MLTLIGLIFDLVGIIVMAFDYLKIDKSLGTWAYDVEKAAKRVRIFTLIGLILIAIGFILQIVDAWMKLP